MDTHEQLWQRYRTTFLSLFGTQFQDWFQRIGAALHPNFQPIRNTQGDGGIDGFVVDKGLVYQVYAPRTRSGTKDATVASKIRNSFKQAHGTFEGEIREWCFLHNSEDATLGKKAAAALNTIRSNHPSIEITTLDIDSLWTRIQNLTPDQLDPLLPNAPPPPKGPPVEERRQYQYHIYLLNAPEDENYSRSLYERLSENLRVVSGGDLRAGALERRPALQEAQLESLVTAAIISEETPSSFLRDSEINRAYFLSKQFPQHHRLVPVLMPGVSKHRLPRRIRELELVDLLDKDPERMLEEAFDLLRFQALLIEARCGRELRSPTMPLRPVRSNRRGRKAIDHAIQHKPWMDLADPPVDLDWAERIDELRRTQSNDPQVLIYIDIDGLRNINSRYDTITGDAVIGQVYSALRSHFPNVQRCGVDEFIVHSFVESGDLAAVMARYEEAQTSIREYDWTRIAPGLYATVSAGYAACLPEEKTDDWIIRAILGSKEAKKRGSQLPLSITSRPKDTSRSIQDHQSP